jgi:hypothetical protein
MPCRSYATAPYREIQGAGAECPTFLQPKRQADHPSHPNTAGEPSGTAVSGHFSVSSAQHGCRGGNSRHILLPMIHPYLINRKEEGLFRIRLIDFSPIFYRSAQSGWTDFINLLIQSKKTERKKQKP